MERHRDNPGWHDALSLMNFLYYEVRKEDHEGCPCKESEEIEESCFLHGRYWRKLWLEAREIVGPQMPGDWPYTTVKLNMSPAAYGYKKRLREAEERLQEGVEATAAIIFRVPDSNLYERLALAHGFEWSQDEDDWVHVKSGRTAGEIAGYKRG